MARGWLVSVGLVIAVACSGRTKDRDLGESSGEAGDGSVEGRGGRATTGGGRSTTGGDTATGGANGGRSATTGGSALTSGGTSEASGGAGATMGSAGDRGDCAIALRHDRCCPLPEAVSRGELESNPCLQEWTPLGRGVAKPRACEFPDCDAPCLAATPLTRSVALDSDGECRFVSECETAADCVSLFDATACCACPVASPEAWRYPLECLLEFSGARPPNCDTCSADVACEPCPAAGSLACVGLEGQRRCEYGKSLDLPPDQCAAEQACAENPMHGCTVCVARGEAACGGPAPPPDECESDAECRERADNLNCEQIPCQNKRCVQGCLADEDCGPSEICDDYRCNPARCAAGGTCTPNHACVADLCVRRSCTTSAECGDFCVNGQCQEYPGDCLEGCAP
jgi:hypothetical protein